MHINCLIIDEFALQDINLGTDFQPRNLKTSYISISARAIPYNLLHLSL